MFEPKNEQGVIVAFSSQALLYGWEFVSVGTSFPDSLLYYQGEEWRTEFEYAASNFLAHKHDHRECDLLICWENDYPDCPFPVISLRDIDWRNVVLTRANPDKIEIEYWKQRALRSERQMRLSVNTMDTCTDEDDDVAEDAKRLAVQLRANGLSNIQISEQLNVHRNTVGKWLRSAA